MSAEQRRVIRETAQYLRQVRPIDPEEIDAYVPGRPHPAVVREALRGMAFDLGLVERADGTFEPIAEESVTLTIDGTSAGSFDLPERHGRALADRLVDRYGPGWPDGSSGDRLRGLIREFKRSYFAGRSVSYDADTALAYAIYHLPDYYAVASHLLTTLGAEDCLPTRLRVLDVGAGVGGPALALFDCLPENALCAYHAVEPSPAADTLEALLDDRGRNRHVEIHRERAESFDPTGEYDLLLFANVLSEFDDPHQVLARYRPHLANGGIMLLTAPADRETATGLREAERTLADQGNLTVYSPTVRLWPGATPTDRCWSFDVKPDIRVPGFQRRLDDAAGGPEHDPGEFINQDVQYAYSILRADGTPGIEFTPDPDRMARMADSERFVTDRVNLVAIKLSHSLSADSEEANPLYLIGDGSQQVDHYAVLTRETALNTDLAGAAYGVLLAFENVLVLWNDDEGSYNLVVDDETIVEAIPA